MVEYKALEPERNNRWIIPFLFVTISVITITTTNLFVEPTDYEPIYDSYPTHFPIPMNQSENYSIPTNFSIAIDSNDVLHLIMPYEEGCVYFSYDGITWSEKKFLN